MKKVKILPVYKLETEFKEIARKINEDIIETLLFVGIKASQCKNQIKGLVELAELIENPKLSKELNSISNLLDRLDKESLSYVHKLDIEVDNVIIEIKSLTR